MQNLAESAGVTSLSGALAQARKTIKKVAARGEPTTPDNERRVKLPLSPAPSTPWNKTIRSSG